MPDAVAEVSITQAAWLVLSNVAISILVGTWPKDQLVETLQAPNRAPGGWGFQILAVERRQRSSKGSSSGREKEGR